MTQGDEVRALREADEPAKPAARDVLEKHPLDGVQRAEPQDLLARRLEKGPRHVGEL
jgi:hypothetical protein